MEPAKPEIGQNHERNRRTKDREKELRDRKRVANNFELNNRRQDDDDDHDNARVPRLAGEDRGEATRNEDELHVPHQRRRHDRSDESVEIHL